MKKKTYSALSILREVQKRFNDDELLRIRADEAMEFYLNDICPDDDRIKKFVRDRLELTIRADIVKYKKK